MFHLSFIALCCASIITCSPTKNHVFELDVEYPPSTDQDSTVNFVSTKNRIINGVDAPNTPWVARIIINYNQTQISSTSFYLVIVSDCGGSLVSPHWVLSARHCFFDGDDQTKLTTNKFWVSLGNVDFFRGQIIPASNVAVFNQYNNGDDLALLRLVNDVSIQPISVQYDDNINYEGKRATIYGWGWTEAFQRSPRVLQTADVVLYGRDQCNRNQVCANPTITNTSACQGDSGGPLVLQENGKLIGIFAASIVVNDVPCQGDKEFYTSTSYYASWIQRTIQD